MVRIGVFARLAQVSIKTLRFYDEVGLLRPVKVDEFTGYRLYALEQLPRLSRILALKDLGLSLEEVAALLHRAPPSHELRALLEGKRDELRQRVQDETARLARVEARLKEIDREGQMSDYDVILKDVKPQLVASVYEVIPDWEQVEPTLNRMFDEVMGYVYQHGGKLAGAPFDIWHDVEFKRTELRVEAVAPLQNAVPENGRVQVYELPGVPKAASTLHRGDFSGLSGAHDALLKWAEANGSRVCGPSREVYLQYERDGDRSQWLTEVLYPIEPRDEQQTA